MIASTIPPDLAGHRAATFDLVEEPWIPVIAAKGHVEDVSLRTLFEDSQTLRRLASPFIPERVALTRLLVAVLQASFQEPLSEASHFSLFGGHARAKVQLDAYFDRWSNRFDLFHPERPFMQMPTDPATKENSIAALQLDWASGNNVTLFDHHIDARPPAITAAQATRALLTTLLYQPGGGVSKPFNRTDSPGSKAVMVIVEGRTLWETLVANCWVSGADDDARPAWERGAEGEAPPVPAGTAVRGHLDRLTWRSRAVRLVPSPDGLVRTAFVQQAYKLLDSSVDDPFVPIRLDGDEGKVVRVASSRRLWQAADSLLGGLRLERNNRLLRETVASRSVRLMDRLDPPRHPQLLFSGLRIDQAKVGDAQSALLPVSDALLSDLERLDLVRVATEQASNGGYALRAGIEVFGKQLKRAPDKRTVSQWSQQYWAEVGGRFPQFVQELAGEEPEDGVFLLTAPLVLAWNAVVWRAVTTSLRHFLSGSAEAPSMPRAQAEAWAACRHVMHRYEIRPRASPTTTADAPEGRPQTTPTSSASDQRDS